jgi:hypothetical protein
VRRNIAILAAIGLALAVSFSAPTMARADTTHGCFYITNIGYEQPGYVANDFLWFGSGGGETVFCNVGIPINGEFEIATENNSGAVTGCLAINNTYLAITEDPASACALNGGAGYPWDRWTATSIQYHSNQLWMFKSSYNGYCMTPYAPNSAEATYASCDTSNHYEWFQWPNSGL